MHGESHGATLPTQGGQRTKGTHGHHHEHPGSAAFAEWQDAGTPKAFLYFEGTRRVVARREDLRSSQDIEIYIRGAQKLDGTVNREIVVHHFTPMMR